jgi:hypothetical protein
MFYTFRLQHFPALRGPLSPGNGAFSGCGRRRQPPGTHCMCEYVARATADSRKAVLFQSGCWAGGLTTPRRKTSKLWNVSRHLGIGRILCIDVELNKGKLIHDFELEISHVCVVQVNWEQSKELSKVKDRLNWRTVRSDETRVALNLQAITHSYILVTNWTTGRSSFDPRQSQKDLFFLQPLCLDRHRGPPKLLSIEYRGSFPGGK